MNRLMPKPSIGKWTGRWIHRSYRRPDEQNAVTIVAYHSISRQRSPLTDSVGLRHISAEFERQIDFLATRFRPISLREAVEGLHTGNLPRRAVVITIDDGFADSIRVAAPILFRRRIPATFFPVTSVIGNTDLIWTHKLAWLTAHGHEARILDALAAAGFPPHEPEESAAQYARRCFRTDLPEVLETVLRGIGTSGPTLAAGLRPYVEPDDLRSADPNFFEFGNHTHTHPILSACSAAEQEREILAARDVLTDLLGRPPLALAYPFGGKRHYDECSIRLARETGHRAALDLRRRANGPQADPLDLSRKPAPSGSQLLFEKLMEGSPAHSVLHQSSLAP